MDTHTEPLADDSVRLREWRESDAAWYAEQSRDSEIQHYTTESPTLTAQEVAAAIAGLADKPDSGAFLIADAKSGEALGNISLDREGSLGYISYWVAAHARGRGVASRALGLLAERAFAEFGVTELRLWTRADNGASRRVAEKADFVRHPADDLERTVKGATWATVAYNRRRGTRDR
jgi:ribosomal-protein-alanine N-acetyltransferase